MVLHVSGRKEFDPVPVMRVYWRVCFHTSDRPLSDRRRSYKDYIGRTVVQAYGLVQCWMG